MSEPVEIRLVVQELGGDRGRVDLHVPEGTEFLIMMMAAEFLMNVVAQQSPAGYEKALELLAEGAMTYRKPKQ